MAHLQAKRKRQVAQAAPTPPAADRAASVEDELLCWPTMQLASQQDLPGSHSLMLAAAPAMVPEDHSGFLKRLCSKVRLLYPPCSQGPPHHAPTASDLHNFPTSPSRSQQQHWLQLSKAASLVTVRFC